MTLTTPALPTQEQIDRIAATFAPDVVRIRMMTGYDWADYPAIFFRVILSDDAARNRLRVVTNAVRDRITEEFRLRETDHHPYFRWRSESEQETLREPSWD
jgi:microcystin degradation protein MlrC